LKRLNFEDGKNGYVISIAIALLIASVLLVWYYVQPLNPGEYTSISLLDSQKQTNNYPEYLVNGVNSTFSIYVEVENHMKTDMDTKVNVLITRDLIAEMPLYSVIPTTTFTNTIADGQIAENIVTISLDEPGNYSVVFELWIKETVAGTEEYEFSSNYCVLNVSVV